MSFFPPNIPLHIYSHIYGFFLILLLTCGYNAQRCFRTQNATHSRYFCYTLFIHSWSAISQWILNICVAILRLFTFILAFRLSLCRWPVLLNRWACIQSFRLRLYNALGTPIDTPAHVYNKHWNLYGSGNENDSMKSLSCKHLSQIRSFSFFLRQLFFPAYENDNCCWRFHVYMQHRSECLVMLQFYKSLHGM